MEKGWHNVVNAQLPNSSLARPITRSLSNHALRKNVIGTSIKSLSLRKFGESLKKAKNFLQKGPYYKPWVEDTQKKRQIPYSERWYLLAQLAASKL